MFRGIKTVGFDTKFWKLMINGGILGDSGFVFN